MVYKQTQNIPAVFQEIVENDRERLALRALPAVPLMEYTALNERRGMLTREAEHQLHWNKNKGATA